MKRWRIISLLLLLLIIAVGAGLWWKKGELRRTSIQTLQRLDHGPKPSDSSGSIGGIFPPAAFRDRTAVELTEFLTKAFRDELSLGGLIALQRDGAFGPLTKLFPTEAKAWAQQASVNPEDCGEFKLECKGNRRGQMQ